MWKLIFIGISPNKDIFSGLYDLIQQPKIKIMLNKNATCLINFVSIMNIFKKNLSQSWIHALMLS